MNGLALAGFVEGQRLANRDRQVQQQHDLSLMQQEQAYGYTAQANPLRLEAAGHQNAAAKQAYDYAAQANPLRLEAAGQQNAAAKQAYDYATQANPLRLGAAQQQLDAGALDLHTNQQLQPIKNAYAIQELTKGLQQSSLDTATREYSLTGNIQPLEQQLSLLYQDQVRIMPNQDGTVSVKSDDGQHTFGSMNEFLGVVLQQQQQASQNWASAGDGWAYNKTTGEAKQLYQPPNNTDFFTKERYKSFLAERKTLADQLNKGTDDFGRPLPETVMQHLQQRLGELDSNILSLTQGEPDDPALSLHRPQPQTTVTEDEPLPWLSGSPSWLSSSRHHQSTDNRGATVSVDGSDQLFMPAPPEAIRFLQENNTPEMQRAFVHKYNYLPDFALSN